MHHPTDVLASLGIAAAAGYLCANVLMRPVLAPLIRLAAAVTDPVLGGVAHVAPVRRTLLDARIRSIVVAVVCVAIAVRIAAGMWANMLDEMEVAVLMAWLAVTVLAVRLSAARYWPDAAG